MSDFHHNTQWEASDFSSVNDTALTAEDLYVGFSLPSIDHLSYKIADASTKSKSTLQHDPAKGSTVPHGSKSIAKQQLTTPQITDKTSSQVDVSEHQQQHPSQSSSSFVPFASAHAQLPQANNSGFSWDGLVSYINHGSALSSNISSVINSIQQKSNSRRSSILELIDSRQPQPGTQSNHDPQISNHPQNISRDASYKGASTSKPASGADPIIANNFSRGENALSRAQSKDTVASRASTTASKASSRSSISFSLHPTRNRAASGNKASQSAVTASRITVEPSQPKRVLTFIPKHTSSRLKPPTHKLVTPDVMLHEVRDVLDSAETMATKLVNACRDLANAQNPPVIFSSNNSGSLSQSRIQRFSQFLEEPENIAQVYSSLPDEIREEAERLASSAVSTKGSFRPMFASFLQESISEFLPVSNNTIDNVRTAADVTDTSLREQGIQAPSNPLDSGTFKLRSLGNISSNGLASPVKSDLHFSGQSIPAASNNASDSLAEKINTFAQPLSSEKRLLTRNLPTQTAAVVASPRLTQRQTSLSPTPMVHSHHLANDVHTLPLLVPNPAPIRSGTSSLEKLEAFLQAYEESKQLEMSLSVRSTKHFPHVGSSSGLRTSSPRSTRKTVHLDAPDALQLINSFRHATPIHSRPRHPHLQHPSSSITDLTTTPIFTPRSTILLSADEKQRIEHEVESEFLDNPVMRQLLEEFEMLRKLSPELDAAVTIHGSKNPALHLRTPETHVSRSQQAFPHMLSPIFQAPTLSAVNEDTAAPFQPSYSSAAVHQQTEHYPEPDNYDPYFLAQAVSRDTLPYSPSLDRSVIQGGSQLHSSRVSTFADSTRFRKSTIRRDQSLQSIRNSLPLTLSTAQLNRMKSIDVALKTSALRNPSAKQLSPRVSGSQLHSTRSVPQARDHSHHGLDPELFSRLRNNYDGPLINALFPTRSLSASPSRRLSISSPQTTAPRSRSLSPTTRIPSGSLSPSEKPNQQATNSPPFGLWSRFVALTDSLDSLPLFSPSKVMRLSPEVIRKKAKSRRASLSFPEFPLSSIGSIDPLSTDTQGNGSADRKGHVRGNSAPATTVLGGNLTPGEKEPVVSQHPETSDEVSTSSEDELIRELENYNPPATEEERLQRRREALLRLNNILKKMDKLTLREHIPYPTTPSYVVNTSEIEKIDEMVLQWTQNRDAGFPVSNISAALDELSSNASSPNPIADAPHHDEDANVESDMPDAAGKEEPWAAAHSPHSNGNSVLMHQGVQESSIIADSKYGMEQLDFSDAAVEAPPSVEESELTSPITEDIQETEPQKALRVSGTVADVADPFADVETGPQEVHFTQDHPVEEQSNVAQTLDFNNKDIALNLQESLEVGNVFVEGVTQAPPVVAAVVDDPFASIISAPASSSAEVLASTPVRPPSPSLVPVGPIATTPRQAVFDFSAKPSQYISPAPMPAHPSPFPRATPPSPLSDSGKGDSHDRTRDPSRERDSAGSRHTPPATPSATTPSATTPSPESKTTSKASPLPPRTPVPPSPLPPTRTRNQFRAPSPLAVAAAPATGPATPSPLQVSKAVSRRSPAPQRTPVSAPEPDTPSTTTPNAGCNAIIPSNSQQLESMSEPTGIPTAAATPVLNSTPALEASVAQRQPHQLTSALTPYPSHLGWTPLVRPLLINSARDYAGGMAPQEKHRDLLSKNVLSSTEIPSSTKDSLSYLTNPVLHSTMNSFRRDELKLQYGEHSDSLTGAFASFSKSNQSRARGFSPSNSLYRPTAPSPSTVNLARWDILPSLLRTNSLPYNTAAPSMRSPSLKDSSPYQIRTGYQRAVIPGIAASTRHGFLPRSSSLPSVHSNSPHFSPITQSDIALSPAQRLQRTPRASSSPMPKFTNTPPPTPPAPTSAVVAVAAPATATATTIATSSPCGDVGTPPFRSPSSEIAQRERAHFYFYKKRIGESNEEFAKTHYADIIEDILDSSIKTRAYTAREITDPKILTSNVDALSDKPLLTSPLCENVKKTNVTTPAAVVSEKMESIATQTTPIFAQAEGTPVCAQILSPTSGAVSRSTPISAGIQTSPALLTSLTNISSSSPDATGKIFRSPDSQRTPRSAHTPASAASPSSASKALAARRSSSASKDSLFDDYELEEDLLYTSDRFSVSGTLEDVERDTDTVEELRNTKVKWLESDWTPKSNLSNVSDHSESVFQKEIESRLYDSIKGGMVASLKPKRRGSPLVPSSILDGELNAADAAAEQVDVTTLSTLSPNVARHSNEEASPHGAPRTLLAHNYKPTPVSLTLASDSSSASNAMSAPSNLLNDEFDHYTQVTRPSHMHATSVVLEPYSVEGSQHLTATPNAQQSKKNSDIFLSGVILSTSKPHRIRHQYTPAPNVNRSARAFLDFSNMSIGSQATPDVRRGEHEDQNNNPLAPLERTNLPAEGNSSSPIRYYTPQPVGKRNLVNVLETPSSETPIMSPGGTFRPALSVHSPIIQSILTNSEYQVTLSPFQMQKIDKATAVSSAKKLQNSLTKLSALSFSHIGVRNSQEDSI